MSNGVTRTRAIGPRNGGEMNENKKPKALDLHVEELEKGRKPGGCQTSSTTSHLCTCPCYLTVDCGITEY